MSEFNDRVRDSLAVANLKQANALLDNLLGEEWEQQTQRDLISRLISVGKNTLGRLNANRDLIAQETIDNLTSASQEFFNAVNLIASNPEEHSYWQHASQVADSLLISASSLPHLRIRTTGEVLERVAGQFDKEVKSSINVFLEDVAEVRSRIEEHSNQVEETSSQLKALLAQLETTANERVAEAQNEATALLEQTQRTSETLLSQVRDAATRIDRELTNMQQAFRKSQKERDEEFANSQNQQEESFHRQLDPTVEDVESFRDQARSMLEEVAGASTAEHYAQQRDTQYRAANLWRIVGVIALVLLVAAAGWIFFVAGTANQEFSVAWLAARTGLLASILVLATYALRQAGYHRRREQDMSRVSNELQILWPFMNRLPDEDRQALLRDITPLYFKGGISAQESDEKSGWRSGLRDSLPGIGRNKTGD